MQHKNQHWIPKSYLDAWCDPNRLEHEDPFVWCFSKDGSGSKRKAPKNVFAESDFYTIKMSDGSRDLSLEHGLAGLESSFVELRNGPIQDKKTLNSDEKAIFCAFVAAMHGRTRAQRDHWQRQWKDVWEMGEAIRESVARMSPAERSRLPGPMGPRENSIPHSVSKELADAPMQQLLVPFVQTQIPILMSMDLCFLCTDDPVGFITSDAPFVLFDPEAYKRPFPYNAAAFGFDTIEASLPLSPTRFALFTWKPLNGFVDLPDSSQVDELNRRTRFYSDEQFVVSRRETRPIWFDPGQPPSGVAPA